MEDFNKLTTSHQRGDPLSEYCLHTGSNVVDTFTPLTRSQALHSMQSAEWMEAEQKEIKSIADNKVLRAAQLPKGKKLLRTKWVYKIKYSSTGTIKSYKARLVACGYAQIFGIDFDETFSPVTRLTSLRILLAISEQLNLRIHQMDVDTAFLNGEVIEEIYIKRLKDFPFPPI